MRTYKLHKLFDSVEISVFDVCSSFNYGQSTFHSIPANLFDFDRERKVVKPKNRGRKERETEEEILQVVLQRLAILQLGSDLARPLFEMSRGRERKASGGGI